MVGTAILSLLVTWPSSWLGAMVAVMRGYLRKDNIGRTMPNPKEFRVTPTYVMLDVAAVALIAIGVSSFAYQHHWIPSALRFDGYGLVLIVMGVALMSVPAIAFLRRRERAETPGSAGE